MTDRSLTPEQHRILREHATERPGTSPLNHEKRAGEFFCAGCGEPLFESQTKYDSGSGWPSFYAPKDGAVGTTTDTSLGMQRTTRTPFQTQEGPSALAGAASQSISSTSTPWPAATRARASSVVMDDRPGSVGNCRQAIRKRTAELLPSAWDQASFQTFRRT